MTWLRRVALLLFVLAAAPAWAQQPVPELSGRVIDSTATLSSADVARLSAKLAEFEAKAGPQIVVLMVESTQPEDIASYAQRVGETWKIGRRDVGDGLLLVIAKGDRKLWIAPAKALEGAVPDLAARQIVRDVISPRFKQNDFAGGIGAGIDALIARIQGESLPVPAERQRGSVGASGGLGGFDPFEIFMFAFISLPIVATVLRSMLGRGAGSLTSAGVAGGIAWFVTHALLFVGIAAAIGFVIALFGGLGKSLRTRSGRHDGWVGTGGWSGGGGGWSGGDGGGGFSSGGGGDFGGGGAGGDW